MMAVVQNASSDQHRIALMSAPEHVRIMCLRFEQHIKHRWCEVVEAKFGFWLELPFAFVGSQRDAEHPAPSPATDNKGDI